MLLNIALHGMEAAAGVRYLSSGSIRVDSPALIRYADDLVVLCHTKQDAAQIKARLARWLESRGLAFNEAKTRVVNLNEGFDFLGFNVRRYGQKPLIRPSKTAVRRIRERLRDELRSLRGSNAHTVIKRLNPVIRGWAAYYRTQVSAKVFGDLDHYLWQLTYKWATFSHTNKPTSWVIARYFGRFNRSRQDRWVFGDRASGAYLHRFAWTGIVRHQIVRYRHLLMTRRSTNTGPRDDARSRCRSTAPTNGSTEPRTVAVTPAAELSPSSLSARKPRQTGNAGYSPNASRSR